MKGNGSAAADQLELPAGFRFHPTDDELVNHYLIKKCGGQSISVPIIAEIDLYKYDPWQLPGNFFGIFQWFFLVLTVVLRSDLSDWFNLEKRVLAQLAWFLGFFERFQLNF